MGCRAFALLGCCVAPLVFRAPEGPAAREARRPHFVRRRASKPARALRSLRRPSHRRRLWFWCARPGPATAHGNRSLARLFLWASWGSRVLSFWGARVRVVTNVVNPRCFSCGFLIRCYKRRQSIGFFADNGGFLAWIDDVCNRGPREATRIALV